eukprot:TRINITY_DN4424_c0_g1_i1.p1 TRINITY_DN4424_c0_g1~~TRINITY_DN4424_c0_g1_i1.p1  ORF type:complete len:190 (-),score=22.94 TRINITY_DN4424_c0_g1_i1:2-571(-)
MYFPYIHKVEVFVGADAVVDTRKSAWRKAFTIAELIIHHMYEKEETIGEDYDIALLRLDYPIIDPDPLRRVLKNATFDPKTIMPICLPPDEQFTDNNRLGTVAGLGITGEAEKKGRCFTDGNGPDVFQQCAMKWVSPNNQEKDEYGMYPNTEGNGKCSMGPTPSANDNVCKTFHEELKNIVVGDKAHRG